MYSSWEKIYLIYLIITSLHRYMKTEMDLYTFQKKILGKFSRQMAHPLSFHSRLFKCHLLKKICLNILINIASSLDTIWFSLYYLVSPNNILYICLSVLFTAISPLPRIVSGSWVLNKYINQRLKMNAMVFIVFYKQTGIFFV